MAAAIAPPENRRMAQQAAAITIASTVAASRLVAIREPSTSRHRPASAISMVPNPNMPIVPSRVTDEITAVAAPTSWIGAIRAAAHQ